MIPYARQDINSEDIDEVKKILHSDFITQGVATNKFEYEISNYCGSSFAVSLNSATSALHAACIAIGLSKGDWLWTSPNSFVASANCALHCGAKVDFVDIDPKTFNISIDSLSEKLKFAKKKNRLPKIIIPVHFAGQPCDLEEIKSLSNFYGFKIIEDASHAIGSSYKNSKIGSCKYSDITVFSFHPVKIITTGEGGAITTNDKTYADKIKRLRSHGITNDKNLMQSRPPNEIWNYQQIELGFNYRMTDIQAALGISQMKRLNNFIKKRQEIVKYYDNELQNLPIKLPYQNNYSFSSHHLYVIRVINEKNINKKKILYEKLHQEGIKVNIHYIPIHLQPYYQNLGFKKNDFPEAEKFFEEAISLPIFVNLSVEDQIFVIEKIKLALKS